MTYTRTPQTLVELRRMMPAIPEPCNYVDSLLNNLSFVVTKLANPNTSAGTMAYLRAERKALVFAILLIAEYYPHLFINRQDAVKKIEDANGNA